MQPQKKDEKQKPEDQLDFMDDVNKFSSNKEESMEQKGFVANLIRSAIETFDNEAKYSWLIPFYQQFSNYNKKKQSYTKIREHLELAGLGNEIRRYHTKFNYLLNGFMLGTGILCIRMFKSFTMRLISLGYFTTSEMLMRQIAVEMDTPTAQEIRNLYRFYAPEDEDIEIMKKKCEDYKQYMQIKREITPSRKN